MNLNLDRLFSLSNRSERLIIGLMSGTSVDGLDVALCRCENSGPDTRVTVLEFETVAYNDDYRQEIKSVFSRRDVDLEKVCLLNGWIAGQHAAMINTCLKKWGIKATEVDLVASHGQTIYHAPKFMHRQEKFSNATLQIGDGDHLAVATGIITLSDFRQKHIAAGGEGAPLAAYGDYLIFSKKGEDRIMLNIGGIANFTYLPGNLDAGQVFSTDTGTGNTLMDGYVQRNFPGRYYDEGGAIAASGTINQPMLLALKEHDFFKQGVPKTTGPEIFNEAYIQQAKSRSGHSLISHEDTMATLNRFSADTIADAILATISGDGRAVVYTSGGGMHNPLLIKNIKEQLPGFEFKTTAELGINPDAKEAVLFAVLANEAVAGKGVKIGGAKRGIPAVSMGKISFPL